MDRRRFVTTLAAAVPARAAAQAPGKVARVGFLSSARRPTDAELQQSPWRLEMQRLRWVEGQNLIVDWRFTDGDRELLARYARELVDARVDVIVTMAHVGRRPRAAAHLHAADRPHLQRPGSCRRRADRELRAAGRQRHRRVAHARRDTRQATRAHQDHAAHGRPHRRAVLDCGRCGPASDVGGQFARGGACASGGTAVPPLSRPGRADGRVCGDGRGADPRLPARADLPDLRKPWPHRRTRDPAPAAGRVHAARVRRGRRAGGVRAGTFRRCCASSRSRSTASCAAPIPASCRCSSRASSNW